MYEYDLRIQLLAKFSIVLRVLVVNLVLFSCIMK